MVTGIKNIPSLSLVGTENFVSLSLLGTEIFPYQRFSLITFSGLTLITFSKKKANSIIKNSRFILKMAASMH